MVLQKKMLMLLVRSRVKSMQIFLALLLEIRYVLVTQFCMQKSRRITLSMVMNANLGEGKYCVMAWAKQVDIMLMKYLILL